MHALTLLRIQAHANRLANHRLHTAMAVLSHAELHATRTSFFPTLMATLDHILWVDSTTSTRCMVTAWRARQRWPLCPTTRWLCWRRVNAPATNACCAG